MNVYLDAQPLLGPQSGISRYVHHLYKGLQAFPDLEVTLAFNRILKSISLDETSVDMIDAPIANQRYPYKLLRRLSRPNPLYKMPYDMFAKQKVDLLHGTNFIYTPLLHGKTVITIHDLAYMKHPESTSDKIYKHHTRWVPYSAQQCDHIIADSYHTKRDITQLLHIPEDKIDVVHLAADSRFKPLEQHIVQPILHKLGLPDRYILFVGTLEPRKNLVGLIHAFHILKRNADVREKLVIVGAKGWKYSPIFELINKLQLHDDIIFTGFIADEDLSYVYNGASVLVMPSIYEGFGLPLLEAMQCGIPVIASDVSSIPEIVGPYGKLIPPHDHEQWAQQLHLFLNDNTVRGEYAALALQRAEQFSWRKVASETKAIYEKVLGQ